MPTPKLTPALDRLPPQALDAEQAVLGCLMLAVDASILREVARVLRPDDFFRGAHRKIYEAALRLAKSGEPTDILTVAQELERAGTLDQAGGRPYLLACQEAVPATSRAVIYAQRIMAAADLRRLIDFGGKVIGRAYDQQETPQELAEWAQQQLARVGVRRGAPLPDSAMPAMFTADVLEHEQIPPPRWAVPDLVPEGLTLVVGGPKLGKSFLALQFGLAIAEGGLALSRVEVERGQTLYLALEDTKRRLKWRIAMLSPDEAAWPQGLTMATEWPRLDDGGLECIGEWCRRHEAARLVIVDTLALVRARRDPRGSVYDLDYADMTGLKKIADTFALSVILVHHQRKSAAEDWMDTVSGSAGITGGADGILVLERKRGDATADLFVTGRDIEDNKLRLEWTNHTGWSLLGQSEEVQRTVETLETLSAFDQAGRLLRIKEVAEALEIAPNTAKQRLWRLWRQGTLVSEGGWYRPVGWQMGTNENGEF